MADTLRASVYERRVIYDQLDVLLSGAAAVSIEGAKGVGKSATAAERVDTEYNLENPTVRSLLEGDPRRILSGERVLLDEWQHVPQTWDLVRRAVDARAAPGTFLSTSNFVNVLTQNSLIAIVACGMTLPLVVGEFDLGLPAGVEHALFEPMK